MILKTKLFGHVYEFKSVCEVMAKANEENPAISWQALPPKLLRRELPRRWFSPI